MTDYGARAGANPRPDGWVELSDHTDHAALAAGTDVSFHADISEFQAVYDTTYPYPVIALRGDNGGRLDYHLGANYAAATRDPKNVLIIIYLVFIPGVAVSTVIDRLKTVIGVAVPRKVAFRIDMESGAGFAGPGDHTAEANAWVAGLAAWVGRGGVSLDGYANGGDWAGNWPGRPAWLKRVTASYGGSDPGTYGWQYYGGLDYPTPAGWPRGCPPFGGWCDMNAVRRTADQIVSDYAAGTPTPAPVRSKETEMFMAQSDKTRGGNGGIGLVTGDGHMKPITNVADVGHYHDVGIPGPAPIAGVEFASYPRLGGLAAKLGSHEEPDLAGPELDALLASWGS